MASILQSDTLFLLFTCEHGGNQVPPEYQSLFASSPNVLLTHRAYDLHILPVVSGLAANMNVPLYSSEITRLLVDLNRSVSNRSLFSDFSSVLSKPAKQEVLDTIYYPYREQVAGVIQEKISLGKKVLHISAHSFVPNFNGKQRNADIGLLYDPSRVREKNFCQQWKQTLTENFAGIRVRMNYPYKGISDGHVTTLRNFFPAEKYWGIELEINQAFFASDVSEFISNLAQSLYSISDNRCNKNPLPLSYK